MCPCTHSDRRYGFGLADEVLPSLARGIDYGVVGVKHLIGEPVLPQVLPDVFDWVQFRGSRRQEDQRHILGHGEFGRGVPPGTIQQQHCMRAPLDMPTDLFDVQLHGEGIGIRQSQTGALAFGRTDGAEQVGILVSLIGRLPGTGAALRP